MESKEPSINWQLLAYAAGGSARGSLDETPGGDALGLLADIESISTEERLERLAKDIQDILSADSEFTAHTTFKEEERCRDVSNLQLDVQRNEVRGVFGGNDRGCDRGACGLHQVRSDPTKPNLSPRLQGTLFFETLFSPDDCHQLFCPFCDHCYLTCGDRWCKLHF